MTAGLDKEQLLDALKRLSLSEFNFNENTSTDDTKGMSFLTRTNFKDRISALTSPEHIPNTVEELGTLENLLRCAAVKLGIPESTIEMVLAQATTAQGSTSHELAVAANKATTVGDNRPKSSARGLIAAQDQPRTGLEYMPQENEETNTIQQPFVGQEHKRLESVHENFETQDQSLDSTKQEALPSQAHENLGVGRSHTTESDGIQELAPAIDEVYTQEYSTDDYGHQSDNEDIEWNEAAQEEPEVAVQEYPVQGIDLDDGLETDYENKAENAKLEENVNFSHQYSDQRHGFHHVECHGSQEIGIIEYYTPGADSVGMSSMPYLRACHSTDSNTTNNTTTTTPSSLENSGDDNFKGNYLYPDPNHDKHWDESEKMSNLPTPPNNKHDPEGVFALEPQKYICGIRAKIFYTGLAAFLLVIVASVLGAVLGTLAKRNRGDGNDVLDPMEKLSSTQAQIIPMYPTPTFTAYPLQTGPWEIKEYIDVEEGICGSHPQAIDRCWNPYKLKFNILKAPQGFKIETDMGILNDKYLYPPESPEGMYSFNVTDFEFPSYFEGPSKEAKCNTNVDAFFMLGRNYKFHLIFTYKVTKRCEKWTGFVAEAGQVCHCEWKGYIFDEFKGQPELTTTLKLDPTPTLNTITETSSTGGVTNPAIPPPIASISVLTESSDSSVDELQKTQSPHTSTIDNEATNAGSMLTTVTAPPVLE